MDYKLAARVHFWNTLCLYRASSGFTIRLACFRQVHLVLARGAKITGSGKLDIGKPWKRARLFPSELIMFKSSAIEVNSAFALMSGCSVQIRENAVLRLGSGFINSGARIECYGHVSIGQRVMIGSDVHIMDGDGHRLDDNVSLILPVVIHDNVWIASRVTILKGVEIGYGAVVASGAVVTRSVPSRTLVAGVPARVIRSDVDWTP